LFIDELKNCHKIGAEEEQWISENVEGLDESQKLNFSRELQNYKEITINVLKNVLLAVTGKQSKGYYWAVCLECGCEYDYELPMCPDCYDRGFECRAKAVKKSEFQPTFKVIKYNKKYLNGDKGEKICYPCEHKKESYCKNFGNYQWNCKREEYEMCECRMCCAIARRANEALDKTKAKEKFSYAMPLKRG
jgi:hypothetical protein